MINEAFLIAALDLKVEMRTKRTLVSMIIFVLLLVIAFNFIIGASLNEDVESRPHIIGGLLWVALIFSGMLGLSRSFSAEIERGSLEGLLLGPSSRSAIYLGKVLSNIVLLVIVGTITMVSFQLFLNAHLSWQWVQLFPVVLLGIIGLVIVGTLLSAIAAHGRSKETFLPILLFPVLIPLIVTVVGATGEILIDGDTSALLSSLRLLAVYDLVFFSVSYILFEKVMEG